MGGVAARLLRGGHALFAAQSPDLPCTYLRTQEVPRHLGLSIQTSRDQCIYPEGYGELPRPSPTGKLPYLPHSFAQSLTLLGLCAQNLVEKVVFCVENEHQQLVDQVVMKINLFSGEGRGVKPSSTIDLNDFQHLEEELRSIVLSLMMADQLLPKVPESEFSNTKLFSPVSLNHPRCCFLWWSRLQLEALGGHLPPSQLAGRR